MRSKPHISDFFQMSLIFVLVIQERQEQLKECCLFKEVIRVFLHLFVYVRETKIGVLLHLVNKLVNNFSSCNFAFIQSNKVNIGFLATRAANKNCRISP